MKTWTCLLFILFSNTALLAQYEPIRILVDGRILPAQQLEEGVLDLYVSVQELMKTIRIGTELVTNDVVEEKRYFLGINNALKEVTDQNYKAVIKKHLPNAPELHKRLGKRGFRYENLRYMVKFYNKFRAKNIENNDRLLSLN